MKNSFKVGDIVILDFNPSLGHEQKGRRPAVVVSDDFYNGKSGMIIVVPVTSRTLKYPFEVEVDDKESGIKGAVLVDHIRSIDIKIRKPKQVGKVSADTLLDIKAKLQSLLIE